MEKELKKDSEWSLIDSEPCRVIEFTPMASVQNGKIFTPTKTEPYASVILECKKIPSPVKGFISHKMDFEHLWAALKEKPLGQNEEVIIFWTKKQLKNYAKIFSIFMPRLWVMVCSKGTFELMTDRNIRPDLQGEERFLAEQPIREWKPEVMK